MVSRRGIDSFSGMRISKNWTKSCGLLVSKGCDEEAGSKAVRLMVAKMRALSQVVPHLGVLARMIVSVLGLLCQKVSSWRKMAPFRNREIIQQPWKWKRCSNIQPFPFGRVRIASLNLLVRISCLSSCSACGVAAMPKKLDWSVCSFLAATRS